MIIGSIGRNILHGHVHTIELVSSQTFLDFDALFIFGPEIGTVNNSRAIADRKNQIVEFLQYDRTVVVFQCIGDVLSLLPVPLSLRASTGQKVDFKGPDYLKIFWESIKNDTQYLTYFTNTPGKPFLFVAGTDKALATLVKVEHGNILFLPWLKPEHGSITAYEQACHRFVAAFEKLVEHISPKKATFTFPPWSIQYSWARESEIRENLVSMQRQVDDLSKTITEKSKQLELEERLKILFTAKGDDLANVVTEVFLELGVKSTPGEPGRDDIVLNFEGKDAVVEVKGKKSSAAEADAAQLEKWVAGFKEDKGTDPKGILLVNAYCETPLTERTDPPFPDQMLKYSTRREHCLMTTTQLLGLLLEARAHPEKRVDLVNSLFSTTGVYQQYSDWRSFLTAPVAATAKS